tara:strand:+ start:1187 stop:1384 length:198 start_codon:yes stop_codon:yes gene_type:complete
MKFILKEIVSRNGAGTDTYERYERWASPKNVIIGFDTYEDAKRRGESLVSDAYNGIVGYRVEVVQ